MSGAGRAQLPVHPDGVRRSAVRVRAGAAPALHDPQPRLSRRAPGVRRRHGLGAGVPVLLSDEGRPSACAESAGLAALCTVVRPGEKSIS